MDSQVLFQVLSAVGLVCGAAGLLIVVRGRRAEGVRYRKRDDEVLRLLNSIATSVQLSYRELETMNRRQERMLAASERDRNAKTPTL